MFCQYGDAYKYKAKVSQVSFYGYEKVCKEKSMFTIWFVNVLR